MKAPLRSLEATLRIAVCAWVILLATAATARMPEWLKPHWAPAATPGTSAHSVEELLRTGVVRFVAADRVVKTYRGALRVMDDHGRAQARCELMINPELEKIVHASAWIISADGRKAERFATHHFVDTPLSIGRQFWLQQRVIRFAAGDRLAAGGVLAWEFQVESRAQVADVHWSFDSDVPSRLNVFEISSFSGTAPEWFATSDRVGAPEPTTVPGGLRWKRGAVLPSREPLPDAFLAEPQLVFVRSPAGPRTWAEFARQAADIIAPRIALTPEIASHARALTSGHTSRWERIRALARFVQRDVTYLAVAVDKDYFAGYRPHFAVDVLKHRYGDCKDKVALLSALLRAIDEPCHPMLVAAGNPTLVRAEWPASVFNHVIVALPADDAVPASWPVVDGGSLGRLVLFDPTDPHTPLGLLPVADQAGYGLLASAQTNGVIKLPVAPPELNRYTATIAGTLDPDGGLRIRGEETLAGNLAVLRHAARDAATAEQTRAALQSRLREGGATVRNLRWTDRWDEAAARAHTTLEYHAERYARRTGRLLLLAPALWSTAPRPSPWKTDTAGQSWLTAATVEKEVRLSLPAGCDVEELPDTLELADDGGTARITYEREGDEVIYRSSLIQPGGLLTRERYEKLRTFLQQVHEAERRPIVLRVNGPSPRVESAATNQAR
jgi:hypothetical protein